jgi:hypothetical protein
VNDLTAGRVDGARLVSHGFVLFGYLVIVVLSYVSADPNRPRLSRSRWRLEDTAERRPARGVSPLRLLRQRSVGVG